MASTVSMPDTTSPNTTCPPSSQGVGAAVDGLAAAAVPAGEVTALGHEALRSMKEHDSAGPEEQAGTHGDDAVELAALVAEAGLAGAKLAEVLDGARELVVVEGERDALGGGAAEAEIEVATDHCEAQNTQPNGAPKITGQSARRHARFQRG
ncbi:unnamed protein product, partial [Symbiodinium sp. KB8]